nr:MAG TPA: hypothetical protein [Caudoviricetes sp.]
MDRSGCQAREMKHGVKVLFLVLPKRKCRKAIDN